MDLRMGVSELFHLARLKQNPISGLFAEFHLNTYIPLKHVSQLKCMILRKSSTYVKLLYAYISKTDTQR